MKRLDSVSRSPVYSAIGDAIAGLPTIRAFHAEARLTQRFFRLLDANVVMSLVGIDPLVSSSRLTHVF